MTEFIGAQPTDLPDLVTGFLAANDRMRNDGVDAVLQATATAFGSVYVPVRDSNGRVHRSLIRHVLAERKFTPSGMVFRFPRSCWTASMIIVRCCKANSGPLMPFIDWRPTPQRNIEVHNDTAETLSLLRLHRDGGVSLCMRQAHGRAKIPNKIDYLRRHGGAIRRIIESVEMPGRLAENMLMPSAESPERAEASPAPEISRIG